MEKASVVTKFVAVKKWRGICFCMLVGIFVLSMSNSALAMNTDKSDSTSPPPPVTSSSFSSSSSSGKDECEDANCSSCPPTSGDGDSTSCPPTSSPPDPKTGPGGPKLDPKPKPPHFADLKGLCFNQSQVAETLDYLSDKFNSKENPSNNNNNVSKKGLILGSTIKGTSNNQKQVEKALEDSNNIINANIVELQKLLTGSDQDKAKAKEACFDLSGYFISNVTINQASDNVKEDVYDRMMYKCRNDDNNNEQNDKVSKRLWAHGKGSLAKTKADIASPHEFNTCNKGAVVGFDIMPNSNIALGVFAKINGNDVRQEKHKAKVGNYGLGLYGGFVSEGFDVKTILSGSLDKYKTTRVIRFDDNKEAKGEFDGLSGNLNIQAGYTITLAEGSALGRIGLRPYAAAQGALINTKAFKETGSSCWNLDVNENTYKKCSAGGGFELTGAGKHFEWNFSIAGDCLIVGKNQEITAAFQKAANKTFTNKEFTSTSVTLGGIQAKCELGCRYHINENVNIYGALNLGLSSMRKDIGGNIGVKYTFGSFGKKKNVQEEQAKKQTKEKRK
jgi:hypothetical protein